MTLGKLYNFSIEWGIRYDPRAREEIRTLLQKQRKGYDKLEQKQKDLFDKERLTNPYSDTRILHGPADCRIRSVLIGVDIEVGEVLLADRLRSGGRQIDLILAHHPEGRAMANFYEVMEMQADILNKLGVPINVAEGILEDRIREVERKVLPVNHTRAVDAARLLDIPFACVHTPADNGVTQFLQRQIERRKPAFLSDVLDFLMEIPEYRGGALTNAGPRLLTGNPRNRTGKVFVDMTGGTGGSKEAFEKLVQAGVGTIVGMHIGEDHLKEAKKHHVNVVIAGHIASDTLGLNLFLDGLIRKFGPLDILACSGFTRVTRDKNT
ncbi:MAG: NGG1p interacting factor NIF3 [Candidatus Abyssobacteria bacterium SURF_17]|uniref:NGG1p interacting factor NIF3 n=1 Tax=Candidatus Abyssobacteria bacterium SURF_17 TaxID=2093361 RepID=A0A419EXQ0_9BACT|nr:MAG: NGG1p interacting factor NIF3 [Candidatus Abyssubacteria bacterium SURF_17]